MGSIPTGASNNTESLWFQIDWKEEAIMDLLTKEDLERQTRKEWVANLDQDELYRLDDIIAQYGRGLTLYVETDWYYDDVSITIRLERDRPETDEELAERLDKLQAYRAKQAATAERRREANARRKAAKLDEERKLYEKLKAKFEKDEG